MSDTFKYTPGFEEKFRNEGRLSLKQRLFYENNGFLVIPHLIEKSLLLKCEERFLDIVHEREQRGKLLMADMAQWINYVVVQGFFAFFKISIQVWEVNYLYNEPRGNFFMGNMAQWINS